MREKCVSKYGIFNPKSRNSGFSLVSSIIYDKSKMFKALLPAGCKKYNK